MFSMWHHGRPSPRADRHLLLVISRPGQWKTLKQIFFPDHFIVALTITFSPQTTTAIVSMGTVIGTLSLVSTLTTVNTTFTGTYIAN